jgi:hypothetical protein
MNEVVTEKQPSTFSVGLKFGLIMAATSVAYFVATATLSVDATRGIGQWLGFLINATLVFLAHKWFKDHGDSHMSYGQGFTIGVWMGVFSSFISSLFTYVYVKYINTEFIELMLERQREVMANEGVPDEYIETSMEMSERFMTPGSMFFFGIVGGMIVVMIVTAIVGIFTHKKNPDPFI